MRIYVNKTLYRSMPAIWYALFALSLVVAVLDPRVIEAVTAIISLIQGVRVSGMREEARFLRGTW